MPTHVNNIVIGSGKIYLALFDGSNVRGGFRYFGDTPGLSVQITTERVTVYGADLSSKYKMVDKVTQVDREFTVTARDVSPPNTALFFGGDAVDLAQSTGTGETAVLTGVDQGLWYLIGKAVQATGVRNITAVAVADGAVTYDIDTDYELDLARGRIYIVEGGGIADGDDITVTYDAPANTRSQVSTTDQVSRKAALHFVADNSEGENSDLLIPYCELSPDGEFSFKDLENAVEMGFIGKILTLDSNTPQMYVDGVAT